jgi:hypothetical protein
MKKILNQLDLKPWDYRIASLVEDGMTEHEAQTKVVVEWMKAGKFQPLLAMIKEGWVLRGGALRLLVQMLEEGQLEFKKGIGHPVDPEAAVRDEYAAATYEDFPKHYEGDFTSDDLFRVIGDVAGMSEASVKQDVTKRRKSKK